MQIKNQKHKLGFTLVETILAVTIIGMVITAAANLTQSSLGIGRYTMNRFAAFHLAEEGLEIVHNMRDSNWLRNLSWRNGLMDGNYVIEDNSDLRVSRWTLQPVESNGGLPGIILSANQKFTRLIELSSPDAENGNLVMHVTSKVEYLDAGGVKNVTLSEDLTDWKKGPL